MERLCEAEHFVYPRQGTYWVVRLDTGDGRTVCHEHITWAFGRIGNPGANQGWGFHVQDLTEQERRERAERSYAEAHA